MGRVNRISKKWLILFLVRAKEAAKGIEKNNKKKVLIALNFKVTINAERIFSSEMDYCIFKLIFEKLVLSVNETAFLIYALVRAGSVNVI